jgi:hypothetical protein
MLRRVALVRTDVSAELSPSIIKLTRIGELGTLAVFFRSLRGLLVTANVVPNSPILVTLMMEALHFSATLVLTRATRRNIPEMAFIKGDIVHAKQRRTDVYLSLLFYISAFIFGTF